MFFLSLPLDSTKHHRPARLAETSEYLAELTRFLGSEVKHFQNVSLLAAVNKGRFPSVTLQTLLLCVKDSINQSFKSLIS